MSTTTYVVRINNTEGFVTRASGTMGYTHALVVTTVSTGTQHVASWHLTEKAAKDAAHTYNGRHADYRAEAVAVEAHEGGKAKVERALRLEAEAAASDVADAKKSGMEVMAEKKAQAEQNDAERAAAKKAERATPAKAAAKKEAPKAATAGARAVPAEAANKKRQAYVAEVGMDRYRQQYNSGWDAATAGQGVKKAATGTASVAWMDGYTDRVANPGKAGIAAKWSALRSEDAPVVKVDAPAPAEAAPAKGAPVVEKILTEALAPKGKAKAKK